MVKTASLNLMSNLIMKGESASSDKNAKAVNDEVHNPASFSSNADAEEDDKIFEFDDPAANSATSQHEKDGSIIPSTFDRAESTASSDSDPLEHKVNTKKKSETEQVESASSPNSPLFGSEKSEGSDGSDEEEYIVEAVLDARLKKNGIGYQYYLKWEGYDDPEDNTWNEEEDCVGCQELVNQFWKKKGGKPPINMLRNKRKAGSVIRSGSSSGIKNDDDLQPPFSTYSRKRRKSVSKLKKHEDNSVIEPSLSPLLHSKSPTIDSYLALRKTNGFKPPFHIKSWEDLVDKVETVQKLKNGKILVKLHWKDGQQSTHDNVIVHHKCPLHIIRFYEDHLNFEEEL
ncbi:heterochromatin (HP1) family chromodomain protein Chp2 [Schizosaccharomyces osmophilus]|uniref:Heterochromatin (HP1) family chromodomain protein Chp2 n=1 Tax=Schizosaccharomyces osmophilus TaxID=2545709 RepID=A0AAF0AXM3_9SCHI|nr:heterochromatin (HP1) family chromodomain protein Chp2 [Schizosaccharomyces osmophilus]WBW74208.1 heterochromatin (HP1) family chromodomain protein Chp2 [Schizosaccharomyces osmophilus]